ncbi:phage tail sheath subtilisin-like domain-containing protein, partial [Actinoplanes sp. NPDC049596]
FGAGAQVTVQTLGPARTPDAALGPQTPAVVLDSITGITTGDVLLIQDPSDDPGADELVVVTAVTPSTKTVTFQEPPRRDHPASSKLVKLTDSAETTTLGAAVTAGPAPVVLRVAAIGTIKAGSIVRLTEGATSEPAIVTRLATETKLASPLVDPHAVGVTVVPVSTHMTVRAQWPGVWGDALRVTVTAASIGATTLDGPAGATDTVIKLASAVGFHPGSVVVLGADTRAVAAAVNPVTRVVTLAAPLGVSVGSGAAVRTQEFTLTVERVENGRVAESERFDRLSVGAAHPRYAPRIVGSWAGGRPSESGGSLLVRLSDDAPDAAKLRPFVDRLTLYLSGGQDDVAGVDDDAYIGQESEDPDDRTGIQALQNEPAISIVGVPGRTALEVQQALVTHCEIMRYRFAVLDVPPGSKLGDARKHRQNFDTTRAALYYPDVMVADPFGAPGDRRAVAPSGHVMGVYARTDMTRGVHKAPANEVVGGVLALRTALTKGEQDILNPLNLNCLRDFRSENRGIRVYGGRVATSDQEWTYVNVRRLLLFIEQSLDTGLQWAVFEVNEKPLWDAVRQSITGFLDTVWRSGALQGTKQEEAFFVNVGYDVTMSQADIDGGRLIVEVGVAPVKPAEFVVVRISQKTREAVA